MHQTILLASILAITQTASLGSGDHKRSLVVDGEKRTHWVHVPPKYDAKKPSAVVLALHGALMDGKMMELFCGLNKTADLNNFIVVYPGGTGPGGILLTWNAGLFVGDLKKKQADDVKYLGKVLDDVEGSLNVDRKRVYAAGLSNGAMMSYRLASEMSDRIAAIATVGGTLAIDNYKPKRPVSVVHFHGTNDRLVPLTGSSKSKDGPGSFLKFRSVDDTIRACVQANGCETKPVETTLEMKADKLKVVRAVFGKGKEGSEVVLYTIHDGGHTWPGMPFSPAFLGLTTMNISANDIMWEFFQKHPMK